MPEEAATPPGESKYARKMRLRAVGLLPPPVFHELPSSKRRAPQPDPIAESFSGRNVLTHVEAVRQTDGFAILKTGADDRIFMHWLKLPEGMRLCDLTQGMKVVCDFAPQVRGKFPRVTKVHSVS